MYGFESIEYNIEDGNEEGTTMPPQNVYKRGVVIDEGDNATGMYI